MRVVLGKGGREKTIGQGARLRFRIEWRLPSGINSLIKGRVRKCAYVAGVSQCVWSDWHIWKVGDRYMQKRAYDENTRGEIGIR